MTRIRLGISSCLLGNRVRYDGQDQLDRFLRDDLGAHVDYLPICPEVECGLPIPREAMRLIGSPTNPRLVTIQTERDLTDQMQRWIAERLTVLEQEHVDGFIFKRGSPSSGLERVKVYNNKGIPQNSGRGLFARAFIERFPDLPVIEEGMFHDRFLRERFLNRIFTLQRLNEASLSTRNPRNMLSTFQAENKLLIMSHAANRYAELGQLASTGDIQAYRQKLNSLLTYMPSTRKHINVMQHMLGYFKTDLDSWEKQEVLTTFSEYAQNRVPIAVPLTLLRHFSRKYQNAYLQQQTYWNILGPLYL